MLATLEIPHRVLIGENTRFCPVVIVFACLKLRDRNPDRVRSRPPNEEDGYDPIEERELHREGAQDPSYEVYRGPAHPEQFAAAIVNQVWSIAILQVGLHVASFFFGIKGTDKDSKSIP